jgi:hypothetical protein
MSARCPLQLKLIDGLKTAVPPGQSLFAADGFSITGGYNSDAQEVPIRWPRVGRNQYWVTRACLNARCPGPQIFLSLVIEGSAGLSSNDSNSVLAKPMRLLNKLGEYISNAGIQDGDGGPALDVTAEVCPQNAYRVQPGCPVRPVWTAGRPVDVLNLNPISIRLGSASRAELR